MSTRPETEAELTAVDREALELAIELDLTCGDAAPREQVGAKLREESWLEVALFCAYGQQCKNLKLEPWQPPPCWAEIDDDDGNDGPIMGRRAAASLLRRMLAPGISRYHPDPLGALAKLKKARSPVGERG
jgi:hypothetical protein